MSKFTKEEAIAFCKKCYKNDDNKCVWHQKEVLDGEDEYITYGCEHRGLTSAKLYCNVCGDSPKEWNDEKKTWNTMPFTAVKTSMNNVDKSPPSKNNTTSSNNTKFELPENSVNCSGHHNDMMGCIKYTECNYCEMPSEVGKDMKCISDNMKSKLDAAQVTDKYSCVDKGNFNLNNINTSDAAGVNSSDYTSYYQYKISNKVVEKDGYNKNDTLAEYNNDTNNNNMNENSTYENSPDEQEIINKENNKLTNESSRTNNNDEDQFFFLGENPSVSESVKYHFDEGYFFDTYTEHGIEFKEQDEDTKLDEYDNEVLEKNNDVEVEEELNEPIKDVKESINTDNNIVNSNVKTIVNLQSMIKDMDFTKDLLNYGLVAISVIMILLFVLLVFKK